MNKTSTKKIIEPKLTEMKDESDDSKEFPYEPGTNVINNILNYSKWSPFFVLRMESAFE